MSQSNGNTTNDALKYDVNMRPNEKAEGNVRWHNPREEEAFRIAGLAWFEQDRAWRRMPVKPNYPLPEAVDRLANHTAGGQILFRTNSSMLSVRVKLTGKAGMVHMPATGQCGVDCYIGMPGEMVYVNTTKYDLNLIEYECVLFEDRNRVMEQVVLYLPLYQGIEEIWIGLDEDAEVLPPMPYISDKKVIIYGTSITQGGCATRPGMAYPNILSRRIPMEFINLGFSGSGKGEAEVAETIAEIENPACLVLDYEANCVSTELFQETLPRFVDIYRKKHPDTPILIVSRIRYGRETRSMKLLEARTERKALQQQLVRERREQGDHNIFFCDGSTLLGKEDFFECTVDGSHPTDLGFLRMADSLTPVLKRILLHELEAGTVS